MIELKRTPLPLPHHHQATSASKGSCSIVSGAIEFYGEAIETPIVAPQTLPLVAAEVSDATSWVVGSIARSCVAERFYQARLVSCLKRETLQAISYRFIGASSAQYVQSPRYCISPGETLLLALDVPVFATTIEVEMMRITDSGDSGQIGQIGCCVLPIVPEVLSAEAS
jgi:hypothetical protein